MARQRSTVSILLLEDSGRLGQVGDIVDVKPGYARNFLFRSGAACKVTPDSLRRVERRKAQAKVQRAKRAADLVEAAAALEGLSLTFEERASEEGHLFGSVGAAAIVEALKAQGVALEEKQIALDHPIKELGIFNVSIKLDAGTAAFIRVWVVEPSD